MQNPSGGNAPGRNPVGRKNQAKAWMPDGLVNSVDSRRRHSDI